MNFKKNLVTTLILTVIAVSTAACFGGTDEMNQTTTEVTTVTPAETTTEAPAASTQEVETYPALNLDFDTKFQTIESFGASGAWWAQYVGGWDQPYGDNTVATREQIATLLYSKEDGIGLTSYRYNLGAGSMDSMLGDYSDKFRRAESFETSAGVYDFTKDANAMWFLNRVVELGAEEVILFSNSPLERLTVSGRAYGSKSHISNLYPENYDEFAAYVMDVSEYMVSQGIPVKYISPINEPQWDWVGGQEGCHYEPNEITGLYLAFLEELDSRATLTGVELSGPESGEWGGKATEYVTAVLSNEKLAAHFKTIDNHSYWTEETAKKTYKTWMDQNYPDVKLRMSEWCEMVNGRDYTMDSAFNMYDEVYEDLTILNVVSWQCWVAVSPGEYRDGLIYVNQEKKACRAAKRLWGFGNYTRFVRPGYQRVALESDHELSELNASAYVGINDGHEELVIVLCNRNKETKLSLKGLETEGYQTISVNVTSENYDLVETESKAFQSEEAITIEEAAIVTLVLRK